MIFSSLSALLMATQGPCPIELPTGANVRGGFTPDPDLPRFTVHNRRSDHAFVKLANIAADEVHVFFVGRQSTVAIDSVPVGEYRVSYAMDGRLGGDCTTLVQAKSVTRFSEPFVFYRRTISHPDGSTEVEIGDNWAELGASTEEETDAERITLRQFNR